MTITYTTSGGTVTVGGGSVAKVERRMFMWYGLFDRDGELKFKFRTANEAVKKSEKYYELTGKSLAVRAFEEASVLYDV